MWIRQTRSLQFTYSCFQDLRFSKQCCWRQIFWYKTLCCWVKWSVVQWRGLNRGVPWRVFMVGEVKWSKVKWGEMQWSEVKVLLKLECYTCGLTTLETRYCCFSYVHFVLICTVVVLYCFVVRVCVCVCVCVCVWVGFVMCVFVRVL